MNNRATAYTPSTIPAHNGLNHWSRTASGRHRQIHITQPNFLTTRLTLNDPIYMGSYLLKLKPDCPTEFFQYYYTELYAYLKRREQELAERNGGLGLPVFLARIGGPLICVSFQANPAATWPNLASLTEYFVPFTDVKQFAGDWTLEYGYDPNSPDPWSTPNSSGTQSSATPENAGGSTYNNYSTSVKVDAPCVMSFYQMKSGSTDAIDDSVQQIIDNWPRNEQQDQIPRMGAARMGDLLFFVTSAEDTKVLDAVVDDVLSPSLQPAIALALPYPRKIR